MKRDFQHWFFRDFSSLNRFKKQNKTHTRLRKLLKWFLTYLFSFPLLFETGSYIVKAGLQIAMHLRIALNFWFTNVNHKLSLAHNFWYLPTHLYWKFVVTLPFFFLTYFSYKDNEKWYTKNFNSYYYYVMVGLFMSHYFLLNFPPSFPVLNKICE